MAYGARPKHGRTVLVLTVGESFSPALPTRERRPAPSWRSRSPSVGAALSGFQAGRAARAGRACAALAQDRAALTRKISSTAEGHASTERARSGEAAGRVAR